MGGGKPSTAARDVRTLFTDGALGVLTDGQLLERFAARLDASSDAAFAILVERHGPMVWGVCRRILSDPNDADDAFQATFFVLVRKAGSVRVGDSLGGWLHGVSRRIAVRVRASAARRLDLEPAEVAAGEDPSAELDRGELRSVLDEELARLPEHYRAVLVLCDLEGLTHEQAAHRLGCAVGTVGSRVARGRERLHSRLTRRGFGPASGLVPSWPLLPPATAPPAEILKAAAKSTINGVLAANAPARASAVARAFLRSQLMNRLTTILVGLTTAGLLLIGLRGLSQPQAGAREQPGPGAARAAKPAEPAPAHEVFVRVVDPQGRAVPDTTVHVLGLRDPQAGTLTSDARGLVRVPADRLSEPRHFLVTATPDERTFGWVEGTGAPGAPRGTVDEPLKLTLLPRTRLVQGKLVDGTGMPISGCRVRLDLLGSSVNGTASLLSFAPRSMGDGWPREVLTDERGRYALALPERTSFSLRARGARFVGPSIQGKSDDGRIELVRMITGGRIVGVIKDAKSGKPVAGAMVGAQLLETRRTVINGAWGDAITDAAGRYSIDLEAGVYNVLFLEAPGARRWTARAAELVRVKAGQDTQVDLTMIEGRRVRGSVVAGEHREGQANVQVGYYGVARPRSGAAVIGTRTDSRGDFELFVPPGDAYIYLMERWGGPSYSQTLIVPEAGDPEPVRLVAATLPEMNAAMEKMMFKAVPKARAIDDDAKTVEAAAPPPPPRRTLSGRFSDPDGKPIPNVRLIFRHEGRPLVAVSDRDGIYVMGGLPPGELDIQLMKEGYQILQASVGADRDKASFVLTPGGRAR